MSSSPDRVSPRSARRDGKRRLEDGDKSTNMRAKRRGYTMVACNECKRRKIKCNGLKPCQRCHNLSLDCVFDRSCCSIKDSEQFIQLRDQLASMQKQINELSSSRGDSYGVSLAGDITSACDGGRSAAPSLPKIQAAVPAVSLGVSETNVPQFHGPTSSVYGFGIAKCTLQKRGITSSLGPETTAIYAPQKPPLALYMSDDPLWSVNEADVIRLCKVYDEEIGIMYPHIDMNKVLANVNVLFNCTFASISLSTGSGQMYFHGADAVDNDDIMTVKMVVAIGLLLAGKGKSDPSQQLYDSVKDNINAKIVSTLNIKSVTLFILAAHFHFQKDEEAQAWRFIGIAARLCIEMGLHRTDNLTSSFPNEIERREAVRNFWVVYALDRRFSFGTGLPFALQEQDLDPSLPGPDDAFPYLKHVTEFNHIAGKVWHENMAYKSGDKDRHHTIGFLDYQVLQWYSQLPESLTFNKNPLVEQQVLGRGARRLRFLMYLRKNQARMSIYRPILYSATSIKENPRDAQTVVDVAKDTILTVSGVNKVSDLYSTQQVCYNYFLVQAMAVIFLAVCHAPADFCDQTRDEFCAVLDLIKGFNTNSYIAKRLWRTIRVLREIGDKIGFLTRGVSDHGISTQPNSGAAVGSSDGPRMDSLSRFEQGYARHDLGFSPEDGYQMSGELTSLFELAGEYSGLGLAAADGYDAYAEGGCALADGVGDGVEGMSLLLGSHQEFSRTIEQLF